MEGGLGRGTKGHTGIAISVYKIICVLVTFTGTSDVVVNELSMALHGYSPASEVLRELNISTLEYVGPDPVTAPQ